MTQELYREEASYLEKLGITIPDQRLFQEKIASYGFGEICLQYLDHFLQRKKSGPSELKKPTSFNELYAFYQLDQELKNTVMVGLQLLEQTFKNLLVQELNAASQPLSLKKNYQLNDGRVIRRGDLKTRIRRIRQNYLLPYADYHKLHPKIDNWVLIKEMSFGVATNYFFLLPSKQEESILLHFLLRPKSLSELEDLLATIRLFRIRAAHNYRLLGIKEKGKPLYRQVISDLCLLKNQDPYRQAKTGCEKIIAQYLKQFPDEKNYLEFNILGLKTKNK